jgi:hypothetical protein
MDYIIRELSDFSVNCHHYFHLLTESPACIE